jgi:hypothetical protein
MGQMPIIPELDRNEAYDLAPMEPRPHGPPPTWWTVTCNGIPVYHFASDRRAAAERYVTDPSYRLSLETRFIHDTRPR